MVSIHAITFDLDDTLWEIEPVIVEAERHVYQWLSRHCPRATQRYSRLEMRQVRNQVAEESPHLEHDLSELRKLALRRILNTSGYNEECWVEQAFDQFMAMRNKVTFFPDALPALEKLAAFFPIASISNGNADLARIGIDHHFSATISARDHGVAKPHRDLFLAACRALDCAPGDVLHIGDHPEHDVLGAADAGLQTIWLNRRGDFWRHERKANAEVTNLSELVTLLNV